MCNPFHSRVRRDIHFQIIFIQFSAIIAKSSSPPSHPHSHPPLPTVSGVLAIHRPARYTKSSIATPSGHPYPRPAKTPNSISDIDSIPTHPPHILCPVRRFADKIPPGLGKCRQRLHLRRRLAIPPALVVRPDGLFIPEAPCDLAGYISPIQPPIFSLARSPCRLRNTG